MHPQTNGAVIQTSSSGASHGPEKSWIIRATNEQELLERARIVLQQCKENNITISQKKLELSNKIKFAGHIISDKGYGPDNDKFTAIANFPHPKNLWDLRAFIGLANQLGMFIPDLAHMTSPLCPLMKRDIAWVWLQEHEDAFLKTKELLTSASLVKPFDPSKEMLMLTDASRLYGIGFALIQKSQDGNNI